MPAYNGTIKQMNMSRNMADKFVIYIDNSVFGTYEDLWTMIDSVGNILYTGNYDSVLIERKEDEPATS